MTQTTLPGQGKLKSMETAYAARYGKFKELCESINELCPTFDTLKCKKVAGHIFKFSLLGAKRRIRFELAADGKGGWLGMLHHETFDADKGFGYSPQSIAYVDESGAFIFPSSAGTLHRSLEAVFYKLIGIE